MTSPESLAPAQVEPKRTPALIEIMTSKVSSYLSKGTLHLPTDYSPENALRGAILWLQESGLIPKVTQQSIIRALETMVIQGLDLTKKQCYLIAYGNSLQCQRSYFGDAALAMRIKPGIEVYAEIVREGDDFAYEISRGKKYVTKHIQELANQNKPIVAAYCGFVDADGVDQGAEIMTIERIKQSWTMSKTYKADGNGTHQRFEDEMALRTVTRRRLKPIINSSNDALLMEAIRRSEEDRAEAELDAQIAESGNGDVIVIEAEDTPAEPQAPAETATDVPAQSVQAAPVSEPVPAQDGDDWDKAMSQG